MSSYSELLRSPLWQKRRLELLQAADWKCERCGRADAELQVHHHIYRKGSAPWEYADHDFSVLCEPHHREATEYRHRLMEAIATYEKHELPMMTVAGFVEALCAIAADNALCANTPGVVAGVAYATGTTPDFVKKFVDIGSGKLDPTDVFMAKTMEDHIKEGSE